MLCRRTLMLWTLAVVLASGAAGQARLGLAETFDGCEHDAEASAVIVAGGDLLMHPAVQGAAYAHADGARAGFREMLGGVADLVAGADLAYANLETPAASGVGPGGVGLEDPGPTTRGEVYSGHPRFNVHPALLGALHDVGFDVVSTANNHALDRGPLGVDRTADALDQVGLAFTGTRRRDAPEASWHAVTEANGLRIAWLACTYGTNASDPHRQVLRCGARATEREIRRLSEASGVDAVIVTPHWGLEYEADASTRQRTLARRFVDAGALAVLGSHPHVPQPWERMQLPDGRDALVVYSLGNLISVQRSLPRRTGLLAVLSLSRGADGQTRLTGARYIGLHTESTDGRHRTAPIGRLGGPADAAALLERRIGGGLEAPPSVPLAIGCNPPLARQRRPTDTPRYFAAELVLRTGDPHVDVAYAHEASGDVRLTVESVLGRHIRTLVDGPRPAGFERLQWDGRTDAGERVSSGRYVVRLEASGEVTERRVPLVW